MVKEVNIVLDVHRTHKVLRGSFYAPPSFGDTFADDDVELNFLGCRAEIIIRDVTQPHLRVRRVRSLHITGQSVRCGMMR